MFKPIYNIQVDGKVVVAITVDRLGNVIYAKPGIKGSTTLNKELLQRAKTAALKTLRRTKKNSAAKKLQRKKNGNAKTNWNAKQNATRQKLQNRRPAVLKHQPPPDPNLHQTTSTLPTERPRH